MVNWEFFDNTTPEKAIELVDQLRPVPRCSPLAALGCTWKEAERVLAGFPTNVPTRPTAAGPSLLGLRIAEERGWRAPDPSTVTDRADEGDQ